MYVYLVPTTEYLVIVKSKLVSRIIPKKKNSKKYNK